MLTEDDIKRKFLPFLKEFYKYRYEYRPESLHTELDNVSAGGLVADGMVSFRKEDGSAFVCTYEATSADKAEEVKYSLNVAYFTWDCLAFAAVVAAVCYIAAYAARFNWLKSLQWTGNTGFLLGMGLIGFFAWYFTMRGWRKYRYIYAVEQFKQYFAHEQWVALGEDVFPAPTDPYLLELKNQCVYNGFGLALVPAEGDVRVLHSPSRLGMYGKDRRMVQWVTRRQWYQAMSQNVNALTRVQMAFPPELAQAWNKLWRPVRYLLFDPVQKAFSRTLGRNTGVFDRFMQAHSVQKWVLALCLITVAPLGYRVLTAREDKIEDILERPAENPEDQYGYLYEGESSRARDPRGIPRQDPEPVARTQREEAVPTINLSGDSEDREIQTINLSGDPEPEKKTEPAAPATYTTTATTPPADDPCARYRRQKGWFVQDNYFSNKAYADERAAKLRRKGLETQIVPSACLGGNSASDGYIVRIGNTQASETAARQQAEKLTKALTRYGLLEGKLLVRRMN